MPNVLTEMESDAVFSLSLAPESFGSNNLWLEWINLTHKRVFMGLKIYRLVLKPLAL